MRWGVRRERRLASQARHESGAGMAVGGFLGGDSHEGLDTHGEAVRNTQTVEVGGADSSGAELVRLGEVDALEPLFILAAARKLWVPIGEVENALFQLVGVEVAVELRPASNPREDKVDCFLEDGRA